MSNEDIYRISVESEQLIESRTPRSSFPYQQIIGTLFIETIVSSYLYSYAAYFIWYDSKLYYTFEDALWIVVLYTSATNLFTPTIRKYYKEYVLLKRNDFRKNTINVTALLTALTLLILIAPFSWYLHIIFFSFFGGMYNSIISYLLKKNNTFFLKQYNSNLYNYTSHYAKALSLTISPILTLLLINAIGPAFTLCILVLAYLSIIPVCQLMPERPRNLEERIEEFMESNLLGPSTSSVRARIQSRPLPTPPPLRTSQDSDIDQELSTTFTSNVPLIRNVLLDSNMELHICNSPQIFYTSQMPQSNIEPDGSTIDYPTTSHLNVKSVPYISRKGKGIGKNSEKYRKMFRQAAEAQQSSSQSSQINIVSYDIERNSLKRNSKTFQDLSKISPDMSLVSSTSPRELLNKESDVTEDNPVIKSDVSPKLVIPISLKGKEIDKKSPEARRKTSFLSQIPQLKERPKSFISISSKDEKIVKSLDTDEKSFNKPAEIIQQSSLNVEKPTINTESEITDITQQSSSQISPVNKESDNIQKTKLRRKSKGYKDLSKISPDISLSQPSSPLQDSLKKFPNILQSSLLTPITQPNTGSETHIVTKSEISPKSLIPVLQKEQIDKNLKLHQESFEKASEAIKQLSLTQISQLKKKDTQISKPTLKSDSSPKSFIPILKKDEATDKNLKIYDKSFETIQQSSSSPVRSLNNEYEVIEISDHVMKLDSRSKSLSDLLTNNEEFDEKLKQSQELFKKSETSGNLDVIIQSNSSPKFKIPISKSDIEIHKYLKTHQKLLKESPDDVQQSSANQIVSKESQDSEISNSFLKSCSSAKPIAHISRNNEEIGENLKPTSHQIISLSGELENTEIQADMIKSNLNLNLPTYISDSVTRLDSSSKSLESTNVLSLIYNPSLRTQAESSQVISNPLIKSDTSQKSIIYSSGKDEQINKNLKTYQDLFKSPQKSDEINVPETLQLTKNIQNQDIQSESKLSPIRLQKYNSSPRKYSTERRLPLQKLFSDLDSVTHTLRAEELNKCNESISIDFEEIELQDLSSETNLVNRENAEYVSISESFEEQTEKYNSCQNNESNTGNISITIDEELESCEKKKSTKENENEIDSREIQPDLQILNDQDSSILISDAEEIKKENCGFFENFCEVFRELSRIASNSLYKHFAEKEWHIVKEINFRVLVFILTKACVTILPIFFLIYIGGERVCLNSYFEEFISEFSENVTVSQNTSVTLLEKINYSKNDLLALNKFSWFKNTKSINKTSHLNDSSLVVNKTAQKYALGSVYIVKNEAMLHINKTLLISNISTNNTEWKIFRNSLNGILIILSETACLKLKNLEWTIWAGLTWIVMLTLSILRGRWIMRGTDKYEMIFLMLMGTQISISATGLFFIVPNEILQIRMFGAVYPIRFPQEYVSSSITIGIVFGIGQAVSTYLDNRIYKKLISPEQWKNCQYLIDICSGFLILLYYMIFRLTISSYRSLLWNVFVYYVALTGFWFIIIMYDDLLCLKKNKEE